MKAVEFFGMPRAGKTQQIKRLSSYLKKKKIKHLIITDREVEKGIKVPFEKALEYSLVFYNRIFDKMINAIHSDKYDLIILDRGFIDSGMWLILENKENHLNNEDKVIAESYMRRLRKFVDFGIFFMLDTKTALERHEKKGEKAEADEYVLKGYFNKLEGEYKILASKIKDNPRILIVSGLEDAKETHNDIISKLIEKKII